MPGRTFARWAGAALVAGGLLTLVINAALSPAMMNGSAFVVSAARPIFLWRQGLSALAAALLLFGSIGLYLEQADVAGVFGGVAFTLACLGTALLMAWEWVNVFVLHELAVRAPAGLNTLENAKGVTLYTLGALIPLGMFAVGWILLAVSTFRVWRAQRPGAALLLIGVFLGPLLAAAIGPLWSGVIGSTVLAIGWAWLGVGVMRGRDAVTATH